jgi:divalent metal cation (Fe/Co/Zn/Cd) transporter
MLVSSAYGFLAGTWPFGVVEVVCAGVAYSVTWLGAASDATSTAGRPRNHSQRGARRQRSASLSAMTAHSAVRDGLVRRGIALEIFTLSWMTVEASVAVAAGVAAGSVALLAFGIDSVIEFVAALVVLQSLRAEQAGRRARGEQRALRIIGATFFLLAAYIVADAGYTLIAATKPDSSAPGVAVSAAALLIMPSLSVLKRRMGTALGSPMLLADAAESLFCAYLSATVLVGLSLNTAFGWWWADPVAALALVPLVIKEGLEAFEGDDE